MKTNYYEYFKYILEHKKNVFKTCWRNGLYLHAFTHDLSKFLPSEFIPYARWFNGMYGKNVLDTALLIPDIKTKHCIAKANFHIAWRKHYSRNKHHWNYYTHPLGHAEKDMQHKCIKQMLCDWEAMSLKFGGTPQEYYLNNYNKIQITDNTRLNLEIDLGLNDSAFHNYGHTLKQFKEMYDERKYNNYFGWIKDKYGIDTYNKI